MDEILESELWKAHATAQALYALNKDPLTLDAMRVIHEAIADVVTSTDLEHELSPIQRVVLEYVARLEAARQTLYE